MPRDDPEDDEAPENVWLGLARDLIVAGVIVAVFLASMYAYAGTWPPLVVVESSSMQHSDRESFLGVIDTGDMVFQQAAPTRSSVITYIEGRASGYSTYGDYGDVIIFNRPGNPTPVIHRAIMYVTVYLNGTADVLDVANPSFSNWTATNGAGATTDPHFLETLTIRGMGWMPRLNDVVGRARGELPWFGLLKLTLQPTDSCCPGGWGDPEAPKNSWDSLLVGLAFLIALPFILEIVGRAWTKYVGPRLPKIHWPWRKTGVSDGDRRARDESGRRSR